MFCTNCGKELSKYEKYCGKCGVKAADNTSDVATGIKENKINNMEYNQKLNNSTRIYGIAFVIILIVIGFIYFNKQENEKYCINLVSNAMQEYDNRARFDITATTSNSINQIMVNLTPVDNYTTNKYGSFYVYFNAKNKNVIRTTSLDIPLRVFQ